MEEKDYIFPVFLTLIIIKYPNKMRAYLFQKDKGLSLEMKIFLI